MSQSIERVILKNLIYNEEYTRRVLPFINPDYFSDRVEKVLFNEISRFVDQYKAQPTYESLLINMGKNRELGGDELNKVIGILDDLHRDREETSNQDWLIEQSETFCQDKAIFNAIMESVNILDPSSKVKADKGIIPKLLSDALAISFDNHIGHDYFEDCDERYEFYKKVDTRIPTDIEMFNKITKKGFPNKTLSVFLAGPKVGKSLVMCHLASSSLIMGYNVLYITLEMAEERISERIDANVLNIKLDDLQNIPKDQYADKIKKLRQKTTGKLIVKEYPTAAASVTNFRALLRELQLKKKFTPHIIFIDYLNICCSSRLKMGSNVNSYIYVKSIAEEIRGLAVEYDVPIISATQTTRGGFKSSDPGLEDTSESFGLPATVDFMAAIVTNDELAKLNQYLFVQLASRFGDINYYKRFVVGVDKSKMKLYNTEQSSQEGLSESGQDQSNYSQENLTKKFNGFKV